MATLDSFRALREGLLLDADYVTLDGRAVVRLWVREGGKAFPLLDPLFEPYFWAVPSEDAALEQVQQRVAQGGSGLRPRRVEPRERFDGLRRIQALKVTAFHPQDVPRLREAVGRIEGVREVREADIPFAFRHLIDHRLRPMGGIAFDAAPSALLPGAYEAGHVEARDLPSLEQGLKVLAFDLEVHNPFLVPRPREDPILIVSVATSAGRVEVLENAAPTTSPADLKRGEAALLQRFLALLKEEDPDVLATYNGDEFDWPYLLERCRAHRLRVDVGRDGSEPQVRQAGLHRVVSLVGRANVDLLRVAQRDLGDVKVKTLKNVADFLGVTGLQDRVVVAKERIALLWADPAQRPTLLQYARDDAVSTLALAQKLLPLQGELARMTRMPLDEETKMGRGRQVDWYLLAEAHERGFLAPNKGFVRDEVYEGGIVLDPPRGLHEGIVALDFSSMYPSIMVSYNVSPETHVPDEVAAAFQPDELSRAPEVGHRFVKEPMGFFPSILQDLVQRRRQWKKALKQSPPGSAEHTLADVKQQTLKILTNAFYGYTGWAGARWYKRECAEATTAWGRHLVMQVVEMAKAKDLEVLYGDSLTAERHVTVRDPQGMARVLPIARLFDLVAPEAPEDDGKVRVGGGGFDALSLDPATGSPVWAPIRQVIRHRSGKRVFRVWQKHGCTRVTEDHALMVRDGTAIVPATPETLAGRSMVRVGPIPRGALLAEVDLEALLAGYASGPEGRQATIKVVGERLAFQWSERQRPITLPRRIPVGSPAFEALCRLVGAYVAEGSSSTPETTTSRMGASIASGDLPWLRQLQSDYHLLFQGARASIIPSMVAPRTITLASGAQAVYQDRTHKLQMMNKLAAVLFRQLCGQRSEAKRLPDFVFNVPEAHQRLVLEHMVRGDGSRWPDPRYRAAYHAANFSYTTKSLPLASGVSLLLGQLGMPYSLQHRPGKDTYTFKTASRSNARLETRVVEEPYDGYVYDLEVEGTHTFVDSCGHVLVHNTDSLFIKDDPRIPAFVERVNEALPIELDVQSRFDVIFFTGAKKRYAGLTQEGKVVVRGLEVRRGDWCELAKELQEEVLDTVLRHRDPAQALKAAQDAVKRVREGKAGLAELTIHKTLTMDPEDYKAKQAHVHAVEDAVAREPGYKPPQGTKIGYVILKAKGKLKDKLPSERARLVEYLQPGDELDADYYIDKQLAPAALRVLEHFGVAEADVKGAPKQQSLKDWF
jgi:DNA polymerase, archaea type